jgi:hypothetical protein
VPGNFVVGANDAIQRHGGNSFKRFHWGDAG